MIIKDKVQWNGLAVKSPYPEIGNLSTTSEKWFLKTKEMINPATVTYLPTNVAIVKV